MKKILLGTILLFPTLSMAEVEYTTVTTNKYRVHFHSDYSDSRGEDTACTVTVLKGHTTYIPDEKNTAIVIEAEGTGLWIDLNIPTERLPLSEGDDFIVKSIVSEYRLTYKNGVLSYQIANISDENNIFYKYDVGNLKINGDLTGIEYAEAQEVRVRKTLFGLRTQKLMSLSCKF